MRHAVEALTDLLHRREDYVFKVRLREDGGLRFLIEWDMRQHGKDVVSCIHFDAQPVESDGDAVVTVLDACCSECEKLLVLAELLQEEDAALQAEANMAVRTLEECAQKKERLEEGYALRVAALVAGKQEKGREWAAAGLEEGHR
jgi:hypothetical protein